jgi:hypothetical protein
VGRIPFFVYLIPVDLLCYSAIILLAVDFCIFMFEMDGDQTYSLAYRVILVFFGTPHLIDCAENNKFPMIPVLVS